MVICSEREIYRYMGYPYGQEPGEAIREQVARCREQIDNAAQPRSVFGILPLRFLGEDRLELGDLTVQSRNLARHLRCCEQAIIFAATLGVPVDRLIARATAANIGEAVAMQAAAAALIEAYCDELHAEWSLAQEKQGWYLRTRFSPGYGDFSIRHQRDILNRLEAAKRIGLTLTDSLLLVPVKSVTAVVGMSREPNGERKTGCESCRNKDCIYQRRQA